MVYTLANISKVSQLNISKFKDNLTRIETLSLSYLLFHPGFKLVAFTVEVEQLDGIFQADLSSLKERGVLRIKSIGD